MKVPTALKRTGERFTNTPLAELSVTRIIRHRMDISAL